MLRLLVLLILSNTLHSQASPPAVSDALGEARSLFKRGKFQEAATAYQAVLEKDKSSAVAHSALVQSYLKADDVSAAEKASAEALKALPESAAARAASGDVYFRKGLFADAENQYKAAVKLDEKCARAWLGMGKVAAIVARQDQAKDAFTKAHTLGPEDGDAWYRWAVLQPYPESANELEKHLAEFHSTAEQERREHEFIDLIKGIGKREVWIESKSINQAEIKLEPVAPRPGVVLGHGLRANFNNSTSAVLLLDTGSTWITIPRKLAEKIGARKISDYGIEGVGDSDPAAGYFAWVDKITVGDVEFHDCVVHVSTKNDLNGADGLVGADIFKGHLITIDFPAHRLRLGPLPEAAKISETFVRPFDPKSNAQIFNFGHLLLLPARVNHAASGLFVLDTGANLSSVTPEFARTAGQLHDTRERVTGSSGEVDKVFALEDAALEFSPFPERSQRLLAFDRHSLSRQLETEVSGFIGFASLSRMRVNINYRDGLVSFEETK